MSDNECDGSPVSSGEEFILTVQCGTNTAKMYLSKLRQGSRAACVMFQDKWLSPNQFQCVSGRRTTKDWKRSIRHAGKTLRQLMVQGQMTVDPAGCTCSSCTGILSDNETPTVSRLPATPIRPVPSKVKNVAIEQSTSPRLATSPSRSPDSFSPSIASPSHPANRDEIKTSNTPMINNIAMPGCTIIPEANDYATSLSGQWTNYYTELFKASLASQQAANLPTSTNSLLNLPTTSNPIPGVPSATNPLLSSSNATNILANLPTSTNPLANLQSSSNSLATTSTPLAINSSDAQLSSPVSSAQVNTLLASQQLQQQLLYQQYASVVDFYSSAARGHGIDMVEYFNKLQQYCQQTPGDSSSKRSHDSSNSSLAPEVKRRHFDNNALDLSVRN